MRGSVEMAYFVVEGSFLMRAWLPDPIGHPEVWLGNGEWRMFPMTTEDVAATLRSEVIPLDEADSFERDHELVA